ncbi:hypothetical protein JCM9492_11080 [Aquifex pyrophilus]
MKVKGFLDARKISVSTTPVEISLSGKGVILYNDGSGKVFVGGASVSVDTGYPIEAGSGLFLELREGARIYVVSDSGASLRILEVF